MSKQKSKQVEEVNVEKLVPYARNARSHSDGQIAQIAASIREFGFVNPVLIDGDHGIIAGHGRVLAARKLGLETVPCLRVEHLTEAQRRAYILADNKLALNASWDDEMLRVELDALNADGFDLDIVGFDAKELGSLAPPPSDVDAEPQVDRADELRKKWGVEAGQLWRLGDHRLLCGDSTVATDVERVLAGVTPLLMVTDPPYGVAYDPNWRNQAGASATKRTGKVLNDDRADWREAWALFPGDVAYVWHGALHATTVADSLIACGFNIRSQIIWAKDRLILSRGDYHWQHEPCWYAVRTKGKGHWAGDRKQTTLWHISHRDQDAETVHGTQKPVECMRRPILNNSSPGQAIYEPFSGSGTTIIAAERTGRQCRAIEISPGYVAVALQRWADATGKTPVLAS